MHKDGKSKRNGYAQVVGSIIGRRFFTYFIKQKNGFSWLTLLQSRL